MRALCLAFAILLVAAPLPAIVNPSLQPIHLMERYTVVLGAEVVAIDQKNRRATLRVVEVVKGAFASSQIIVDASADEAAEGFANLQVGGLVVAYVGKPHPRRKLELMLYSGNGRWGVGAMDASDPGKWAWTADPDKSGAEEGKGSATMWGTFAGRQDRLLELMRDQAAGTAFFNPLPMVSFDNDLEVGKLAGPARGVALYDLDGDGRPDVLASSEKGVKIWLQKEPLKFTDATAALKLATNAVSVNVADATGSGKPDLLLDGVIWRHQADGTFAASELLPKQANEHVLCSAFMDVDGDGWPDVLVSKRDGGLAVYRNPGAKGGAFSDATSAAGLDRKECGAGLTGYFAPAPADWDGGTRAGLWYSAGAGFLLRQDATGVFTPVRFNLHLNGTTDLTVPADSRSPGQTGGAVWAAQWTQQQPTLFLPLDNDFRTAFWEQGALLDATRWANELSERTYSQSFSIAEDLDMDGTVDTWTASRSPGMQNTCHLNRGYGSWMRAEKYKHLDQTDVFNSEAHIKGAGGAAAGDANGDGFNDLLIGSLDGTVSLLISDLPVQREQPPTEQATYHLRKLGETGIVSVRVTGRQGVTGATVTVQQGGRVLGRRDLGANVASGCRGPDTVNLAVRELGECQVLVRFADGTVRALAVTVQARTVSPVTIDHGPAK